MSGPSVYQLPQSLPEDLEQLRQLTGQFQRGEIPAARYQAFRVPQGVYEQRESGTFMLRARLAAGILKPEQMRVAAEVAETYGDGTLHLTSRQDLQIHGVKVEGIYPAVARLAEAGLSTKGGGGNTVRNIAACYLAGACPDEVFDVTPHVVGLTEFLLPDPLSFQLPRKYKLACSGCSRDCAGATISDLGFIGKRRGSEEGFAVYAGGGMGAHSRVGRLLEEFIPAAHACRVAEAVKRVFDKHGNRKNRHRARLRFLVEDVGFEAFEKLYREELDRLGDVAAPPLRARPAKPAGSTTVEITPPLGVLQAEQIRRLADVVERFGAGILRATNWQTAVLRGVSAEELPALDAELAGLGLGTDDPAILKHLVTCTGASTCRLGICLSRGLAEAIRGALLGSDLDLKGAAGEVTVHISGCPNACGRHPVGQIGLYGAARRVNGRLVPHYVVQLGGHVEEGKTVLASGAYIIPARSVPGFLVEFLRSFESSEQHSDFVAYLAAGGRQVAEGLSRKYAKVPEFAQDKNYYFDWGAEEVFSLAGRGPGECGAGVFDLIQVDLASAGEALEAGRLFSATALAARALLVTRGEQADADRQSLELFRRHFVEPGVVSAEFKPLIEKAQQALTAPSPEAGFDVTSQEVASLLAAVRGLYESMGPSLRLPAPTCAAPLTSAPSPDPVLADVTQDLRGVVCPLNYVKTKMALGKLNAGQVLAVLLDEKGSQNVPTSAANDGHEVLSVAREAQHWRVAIRKGKL
jgi:sulfite reductase (ferredoxin)